MPKVKDIKGKSFVWDRSRKKYVALQPEEYQRQCLIDILVDDHGYPIGLASVETGLKVGKMQRRYDLLFFDSNGNPLLLAECKAENVKITARALEQLMAYNSEVQARIIILFNGPELFCWEWDGQEYVQLDHIPKYESI